MPDTIFFTLCSNNYLAQAKCLGDSVISLYPKDQFVIGLVDKEDSRVDYSFFSDFTILPFDDLGYLEFEPMLAGYNVIEFNTSVKPFFFDYLFKRYKADHVIYLDPDILLYQPLAHVFEGLKDHSIVLTPMFCEVTESTSLDELVALRHGMFNLGFIALKYSAHSQKFIAWWKERLRTHCLIDKPRGIFVDQKWVDLAPLLFDEVFVLKHRGYNMAWWNFSERRLLELKNGYGVNQPDQFLHFFHFSGFKPDSEFITGRSGEEQFAYANRPELKKLGQDYQRQLIENNYEFYNGLKPKLKFFEPKEGLKTRLKRRIKGILSIF